jgi:hypothetical protein
VFKKILIANRGDNGRGAVAAKTHAGEAGVMSQPHRMASEASGERAAGADRV